MDRRLEKRWEVMEIPVLIEPVAGNGYVARAGSPFNWSAEGSTPEEAVQRLQAVATAQQAAGMKAAAIRVGAAPHPLLRFLGSMKGDPLLQEWRKAVEEYRDEIELDPNR
jgi:hypothetical protein